MEKILTKEEAVVMLLKRFAADSNDRLIIESCCAVIHEHGVKSGLLQAHRTLVRAAEAIMYPRCTGMTRTCPCLACRSVRADDRQDRRDQCDIVSTYSGEGR